MHEQHTPLSRPLRQRALIGIVIIMLTMIPGIGSSADPATWLLVDTSRAELHLMQGERIIRSYENIAIGRRGATPIHFLGDDSTPVGDYRIDHINLASRYGIFLSLNYPLPLHARMAAESGRLSVEERNSIEQAHLEGRRPPYDTALGGMIGIHGIGKGSLKTHREFNWTHGCVALDNEQMSDLARRVQIGTRVVIR